VRQLAARSHSPHVWAAVLNTRSVTGDVCSWMQEAVLEAGLLDIGLQGRRPKAKDGTNGRHETLFKTTVAEMVPLSIGLAVGSGGSAHRTGRAQAAVVYG